MLTLLFISGLSPQSRLSFPVHAKLGSSCKDLKSSTAECYLIIMGVFSTLPQWDKANTITAFQEYSNWLKMTCTTNSLEKMVTDTGKPF